MGSDFWHINFCLIIHNLTSLWETLGLFALDVTPTTLGQTVFERSVPLEANMQHKRSKRRRRDRDAQIANVRWPELSTSRDLYTRTLRSVRGLSPVPMEVPHVQIVSRCEL